MKEKNIQLVTHTLLNSTQGAFARNLEAEDVFSIVEKLTIIHKYKSLHCAKLVFFCFVFY